MTNPSPRARRTSTQQSIDLVLQETAKLPKLVKPAQSLATHATDFDMWLACYTQEEIAKEFDLTHKGVAAVLEEMATLPKLPKSAQSAATHATDFDMWLACYTQEEIAEAVGCSKGSINEVCSEMATLPKLNKSAQSLATHATDFDPHRAMVGARLANLKDGQRADYIAGAQICAPVSQSDAAEQMQVSRRSVQNAEVVQRDGIPELEQSVWDNRVSVSAAAEVATLPEEEQREKYLTTVSRL